MFDGLIKKTKIIESEIDLFLDNITKSALVFKEAIRDYSKGEKKDLKKRIEQISDLERQTDEVRREIKFKLYREMLIPDARGDVLGLLETMDDLVDIAKEVVVQIDIEKPEIFPEIEDKFLKLADYSSKAIESTSKAGNAYFRNITEVNNYINKVKFYETEADDVETEIKKIIFDKKDCELSKKIHLRDIIVRVAFLSDEAEEVCERIAVYSIKRNI
ncbi:MAG: DUF47 family protein [Candidatus Mcinerneyibacterium aminivorans]|uniref:DUF47 family protein n=1 Tax=Candidatus Mcinerneyibacterium aminivorans TaxID=2703815 RepID=A0A5D0MEN7_9BACT|nr:MAG: DUF47 family protein [Candidatus Mcinerneyibacterium aminivorans]